MTTPAAVIAAVVATLSTVWGAYNLSGDGQVLEGTYSEPPGSFAFAAILPAELTDSKEQALGSWFLEDWTLKVRVWAPTTEATTTARATASRAAAAEAVQRLDTTRATLGTAAWKCIRWAVTSVEFDPAGMAEAPAWGRAEISITFSVRRQSGTGA